MNVIAINDIHHEWRLKIHSKLHKPLGECNLKEFLNIMSSVNPYLLELSYDYSYVMTEKITKSHTLIRAWVQIKNYRY